MLIAKTYTHRRILTGMEYNSVTFVAYFSAAVISALLTMTYLYQLARKQKTWAICRRSELSILLHLGAIALSFSEYSIPLYLLIIFEYLHFNAWVFCIGLSLKRNSQRKQLPTSLQLLFSGGWPITALAIGMMFIPNANQAGLSVWFALGLAVIALVSVEQLYRYAGENDRQIKLLCMNLAAIFLYDIYLFTHGADFQRARPHALAIARGRVHGNLLIYGTGRHPVITAHRTLPPISICRAPSRFTPHRWLASAC